MEKIDPIVFPLVKSEVALVTDDLRVSQIKTDLGGVVIHDKRIKGQPDMGYFRTASQIRDGRPTVPIPDEFAVYYMHIREFIQDCIALKYLPATAPISILTINDQLSTVIIGIPDESTKDVDLKQFTSLLVRAHGN